MKQFKWGVIGPGKIANKFAVALPLAGGAKLEAVASRDIDRARQYAERYGAARYYDNYEELAADPAIDAIYVATPHAFHLDHVLLCLAQGKPVLCEKPLALSQRQVGRMVEAAREHKTFLMEGMWTRFLPIMEKAMELIREGQIGKIKYIRADFGFAGAFHPENRLFNLALGGGALLDIGVYPIFLCLQLMGMPGTIRASGHLASTGADESVHAFLGYEDGRSAVISATFACQTSITAEIAGTEGMIQMPSPWYKNDNLVLVRPNEGPRTIQVEPMINGFEYEIRELMSCVEKGLIESPAMSHSFSMNMAGVMDTIRGQVGVVYPGQ